MAAYDQTTENSEHLTPKQEMLIALLLAGVNISAAATQVQVNESTAHRWLNLPHVQQAYRDAQHVLFDQALTSLMLKVDKAITTLDRNMDSDETPASTQVRAAQIVLEMSLNVHKMGALEAKIAELEQYVKQIAATR